MRKLLTILTVAASCGCNPVSSSSRSTAEVESDATAIVVIAGKLGEELSKEIAVSGRVRRDVPRTRDWSCGVPNPDTYASNVAWIELYNASSDTLSLSIEVTGLPKTYPTMFVYEHQDAPIHDCLTLTTKRKLSGASSVIVEPTSSAFVLLSAGAATGVYTLAVKTEHVIVP
jgi:hypothetical protein